MLYKGEGGLEEGLWPLKIKVFSMVGTPPRFILFRAGALSKIFSLRSRLSYRA
jgi:hypothetical protein